VISHLRENNEAYFSHLAFAGRAGLFLMLTGMIFLFHGLLPFVSIPKKFNLEAIIKKLSRWNDYTEERIRS